MTDELSVRVTKINSHPLTAYISGYTSIFNSLKLPNYLKEVNQITLNQTALLSLVLPIVKVFNLILIVESNSPDTPTFCKQTWKTQLIFAMSLYRVT